MDPAYDIPDGVQKAAEQVVREVIKEVHGPFFNSEVGCRFVQTLKLCSNSQANSIM
jgi:hypothetical protein